MCEMIPQVSENSRGQCHRGRCCQMWGWCLCDKGFSVSPSLARSLAGTRACVKRKGGRDAVGAPSATSMTGLGPQKHLQRASAMNQPSGVATPYRVGRAIISVPFRVGLAKSRFPVGQTPSRHPADDRYSQQSHAAAVPNRVGRRSASDGWRIDAAWLFGAVREGADNHCSVARQLQGTGVPPGAWDHRRVVLTSAE